MNLELTEEEADELLVGVTELHLTTLGNLEKSVNYQLHDQVKVYRRKLRIVKALERKLVKVVKNGP